MKTSNITELFTDNVLTSDDSSIAETPNDFFVTIGYKLASEISGDLKKNFDIDIDNNSPCSSALALFKFPEISEEIIITELRNLQTSKSTGIDGME